MLKQFSLKLRNIVKNQYLIYAFIILLPFAIYLATTALSNNAPKIEKSSDSSYLYEAKNETFGVKLGSSDRKEAKVEFNYLNSNNIQFTYIPQVAKESNELDIKTRARNITFKDVDNHIDLEYIPLPNGIKENIVIKQKQENNRFFFKTEISDEIVVRNKYNGDSTPAFFDKSGKYLFHIQKGYAIDALGKRTEDVAIDYFTKDNEKYLRVTVDKVWLNNKDRKYPIKVDPTIVHDQSSEFTNGDFNRSINSNDVLQFDSTNVAAGNAYTYLKVFESSIVVNTGDRVEYDVYNTNNLAGLGGIDIRYSDTTYARSSSWTDQNATSCAPGVNISSNAYNQWFSRVCTITSTDNGKTISYIDLVNEVDSATAITTYYDNIVIKNSSGVIKAVIYKDGGAAFNTIDITSNGSNTATATRLNAQTNSPNRIETNFIEASADQYTVGLWHMNEGSDNTCSGGQDVCDFSGNGNHGTFNGNASFTKTARIGSHATQYDGNGDYILAGDIAVLDTTKTLSACAWINMRDVTNDQALLGKSATTADGWYFFRDEVGSVSARTDNITIFVADSASANNTRVESANNLGNNLNGWTHICTTMQLGSPTGLRLYINGVEDFNSPASMSTISAIDAGTNQFSIGARSDGLVPSNAIIDEVLVTTKILTPVEIKQLATRSAYSSFTSEVIDLTISTDWNNLTWEEIGISTGNGETLVDSTDLVAQWNFNNTSGTTATNNSGSCSTSCNGTLTSFSNTTGQDATPFSGWTSDNRRWGAGALMFDGTDDHITIPDTSSLSFGNGTVDYPFSISTWVYPKSFNATGNWIINKRGADASDEYQLVIGNGVVSATLFSGNTNYIARRSNDLIQLNKWQNIVMTYNGSKSSDGIKIYIDGKEVATTINNSGAYVGMSNGTHPITIGKPGWTSNYYFHGFLDSTTVFSRVLSESEILSNYNSSNLEIQTRVGNDTSPDDGSWEEWRPSGNESSIENFDSTLTRDLISYWKMEEISGNRVDNWGTNTLTPFGTGGVGYQNGKIGNGADLEFSESDYLEVNDNPSLSTGDIDFTISTWMKMESTTGARQSIITKSSSSTDLEFELYYIHSTSRVAFSIYSSTGTNLCTAEEPASISLATWYLVTAWHDSVNDTCSIKVNNNSTVTNATTGAPTDTTAKFRIGARYTAVERYFDGMVDNVAFWKRVLTTTELSTLYNQGSTIRNIDNSNILSDSHSGGISTIYDSIIKNGGSASQRIQTGKTLPDSNTISLWRLDETWGSSAFLKDIVSGADGTPQAGATTVKGLYGQARRFNGATNAYISFTSPSGMNIASNGEFSVDGWVKTTDNAKLIWRAQNAANPLVYVSVGPTTAGGTNNSLVVYLRDDGGTLGVFSSTAVINDGKWRHIAATVRTVGSVRSVILYVDGVQDSTHTWNTTGAMALSGSGGYFGGHATNYNLIGDIDEFRFSNVVRTPEEIYEASRLSNGHNVTYNFTSTNLGSKSYLPIDIAADRPGNYISTTFNEDPYVNYMTDENTMGLWKFEDNISTNSIVYEGSNSAFCSTAGTTCTISNATINLGAGNNRLVIVGVATELAGDITNVTFNGVSGTEIAEVDTSDANASVSLWYFLDSQLPTASGSYSVVATTNSLINRNVGSMSFHGVAQKEPDVFSQLSNTGSTSISTTVTTVTPNSIIVDAVVNGSVSSLTAGGESTHTKRWETLASTSTGAGGSTATTTAGTKTISYSAAAASRLGLIAAAFSPAGVIRDESGNGNHGIPVGTTVYDGKDKLGRFFNGTSDYIQLGSPSTLNITGDLTVDAWVYNNNVAASPSIITWANGSYTTYPFHILITSTQKLRINDGTTTFDSTQSVPLNSWAHVALTISGNTLKMYINGELDSTQTINSRVSGNGILTIGRITTQRFTGAMDSLRVSNVARTQSQIKQTYERSLRNHQITIDFGAKLDNANIITTSADYSFTIDATRVGLPNKGSNIFKGDKIIAYENYNGTEYRAQGTVTSVNKTTGAIVVASWDSGSTFPPFGYSLNTDIFKWQREYIPISNRTLSSDIDAITNLNLRIEDGYEGRNIWVDNFKSTETFLTNPVGSTITSSTGNQYFQYRIINSSTNEYNSASVSEISLDYDSNVVPNLPTLNSPSDKSASQSLTPTLQTTATDPELDYLRYKIELCTNFAMTQNCSTFDQTSSQTGWSGQNTQTNTAYTSGTQASYTLQSPLSPNTTYYWRSYAIDPGGSNSWSATQTAPYVFSTNAKTRASQSYSTTIYSSKREAEVPTTTIGWSSMTGTPDSETTGSGNGWVGGSNLVSGREYLIIATGSHNTDNSSGKSGLRVKHGSTVFENSESVDVSTNTTAAYKTPYFWFTVWSATGGESIEIEQYWNGTGTQARVEDVSLLVIDAEDLIDSGYLQYSQNTTYTELTSSFANTATTTFTPANANDQWWIMGYNHTSLTTGSGAKFENQILINSTQYSNNLISINDSSLSPVVTGGTTTTLPATSQTIAIQAREHAIDQVVQASGVFALNLKYFESFQGARADDGTTLTTPSSWVNQFTLNPINTFNNSEWIIAGGANVVDNGGRVVSRIIENVTSITDDSGGWNNGSGDKMPLNILDYYQNLSIGLKTFKFDTQTTLAGTSQIENPWFVAFTKERNPSYTTMNSPTNSNNSVETTPALMVSSIDPDGDYIRYKIQICTNLAMSTGCNVYDQTSSQTGWSGQNTLGGTAYTSGTQATYTIGIPLTNGQTYYWRAYSIDPAGTNSWSSENPIPYSFTVTTAPTAPTEVYIEGVATPTSVEDLTPEISAIFNDPEGDNSQSYQIQVNTNNTFTGTEMWNSGKQNITVANGARSSDISYAGTALALDGTTYYVRIRFWDIHDTVGAWSDTTTFKMKGIESATSCYLVKNKQSTSLTLNWKDNTTQEEGYRVERKVNGGSWTLLSNKNVNSTTHADSTISFGNTYQYRVGPVTGGSVSTWCTTDIASVMQGSIKFEGLNLEGVQIY